MEKRIERIKELENNVKSIETDDALLRKALKELGSEIKNVSRNTEDMLEIQEEDKLGFKFLNSSVKSISSLGRVIALAEEINYRLEQKEEKDKDLQNSIKEIKEISVIYVCEIKEQQKKVEDNF